MLRNINTLFNFIYYYLKCIDIKYFSNRFLGTFKIILKLFFLFHCGCEILHELKILLWIFNISKFVLISKCILWLFSKTCLAKFELRAVFFNFISEMCSKYFILKFIFFLKHKINCNYI
jgi:hypothetical protein